MKACRDHRLLMRNHRSAFSTRNTSIRNLCDTYPGDNTLAEASIRERVFLSHRKGDIEDSDLRSRANSLSRCNVRRAASSFHEEAEREAEREKEGETEKERLPGRDADPLRQDIGQDLAVDSRSFPSDSRALFLPIPRPDRHKTQVTPVFMPVVFTPVATPAVPRRAPFCPCPRANTRNARETRIYSRVSVARPVTPRQSEVDANPCRERKGWPSDIRLCAGMIIFRRHPTSPPWPPRVLSLHRFSRSRTPTAQDHPSFGSARKTERKRLYSRLKRLSKRIGREYGACLRVNACLVSPSSMSRDRQSTIIRWPPSEHYADAPIFEASLYTRLVNFGY